MIRKIPCLLIVFACVVFSRAEPAPEIDEGNDRLDKAYALRINADHGQAKKMLELELNDRPDNASAWFELARLEFYLAGRTQDMAAAQRAITRAVEIEPQAARYRRWSARTAMYRGILMAHKQDTEALAEQFGIAIQAARKAIEIDPDDVVSRRLLVSLYGNNPPELGGDLLLAQEQVEALEEKSPIDGAAARCEFSYKGKPDQRLAVWAKLAEEHDSDPQFHQNLAKEFARADHIEQATKHAERAIRLDPSAGYIFIDLARILAMNRKLSDAERFANRYLDYEPAGPNSLRAWTWFALGQIQRMKGDDQAAAVSLKKAAELDPQFWTTMTPPPRELFEAMPSR